MSSIPFRLFILSAFVLFFNQQLPAKNEDLLKDIYISGLKIYNERDIIKRFRLDRLAAGRNHFRRIEWKINSFYHQSGYLLARVYLIRETDSELYLFIDEGLLEKVVFYGLNSIDTLKIKYNFRLKYKIYNKFAVDRETEKLKKKYGFKKVYAILKPTRNYEDSLFQLDREFDIPIIGPSQLPSFKKYGSRFMLEIHCVRHSRDSVGFSYGFKTSYTKGLIPYLRYQYPSIFFADDKFEIGGSIGLFYGLDLNFSERPKWTFMEIYSRYYFPPTLKEYFTPRVSAKGYRSRTSRIDIGLSRYDYLMVDGVLSPGITLFRSLKIYTGYGGEKVYIFESEKEPDAAYMVDINEHVDFWNFIEFETGLDIIPWTLKMTIQKVFRISYRYYFNNNAVFHDLTINGSEAIELKNFDIYNLDMEYKRVWNNPPFYHEEPVDSSEFKGFMGKSYYSRNIFKISNEYRISLYRDFLFLGFFIDISCFEGSGYDLEGVQYGVVSGVGGHIIFLDQFEANLYFGKDLLFSKEESQYNIYASVHKKW